MKEGERFLINFHLGLRESRYTLATSGERLVDGYGLLDPLGRELGQLLAAPLLTTSQIYHTDFGLC